MNLLIFLAAAGIFISWGVGAFIAKLAADRIGTQSIFWDTLGYAPAIIIYGLIFVRLKNIFLTFQSDKPGVLLAFMAGLTGSLGSIAFYFLLSKAEASTIIPLTALYPALAAFLAIVFLHEGINFTKVAGIILSLIAIYLLSK